MKRKRYVYTQTMVLKTVNYLKKQIHFTHGSVERSTSGLVKNSMVEQNFTRLPNKLLKKNCSSAASKKSGIETVGRRSSILTQVKVLYFSGADRKNGGMRVLAL